MNVRKGILRSFDIQSFTAAIELSGSGRAYLEGLTVARSVPSAEMQAGRQVAVVFFDEHNAADAVVVAVY